MGLAIALALLLLACAEVVEEPGESTGTTPAGTSVAEDGSSTDVESYLRDTSESEPVPEELVGTWVYSHEECEPEGEPSGQELDLRITFAANRTYSTALDGKDAVATALGDTQLPGKGTYTFEDGDYPRITLDNWLNFNVEGETLQNWSEGDAVYLCGAVFVREGR